MREDVRAARALGRRLIAAAFALSLLLAFLWVASPGGVEGMSYQTPWYAALVPLVAVGTYLTGLVWMIRIYRTSHLEPETSSWRYRHP